MTFFFYLELLINNAAGILKNLSPHHMCTDCFTEEIKSFGSAYQEAKTEWNAFSIILTQKIEEGQLVRAGTRMAMDYVRSEYFWDYFVCKTCAQKWTLFEPFINNESVAYTGGFIRYKLRFWERLPGTFRKLIAAKAAL